MKDIDWSKVLHMGAGDWVKLVITALVVLFVTKIQLVSDKVSALLIALPITSIIAMVWMNAERQGDATERVGRIANHAEATFWFVLPTMPMFLILPWMLRKGWGFFPSLLLNCLITAALFWLLVFILRRFGYNLI